MMVAEAKSKKFIYIKVIYILIRIPVVSRYIEFIFSYGPIIPFWNK